jgi:putative ABC transport system permease protein
MSKYLKIAFRNIIKNRRRSFVTMLAIAVGFAAVSLFNGYAHNTYLGLRNSAVSGEGLGHLAIYKRGWLANGNVDPDRYMLTSKEIAKIINIVEADDDVILATPKLHLSGLITNGRISTIFLAEGVVPEADRTIKGSYYAFRPVTGDTLSTRKPFGVEIASDLAKTLSIAPGADVVVMAGTMEGQMNALDVSALGLYDTGIPATNDKFVRMTYKYAQSLYDTDKAEQIIVLLSDWQKTGPLLQKFKKQLSAAGIDCDIKTWEERSLFYRQVKNMLDMMFLFMFLIVLVIVIMSVVNTMGMAVLERTREIGTLRALGLKRRGVGALFAAEGAMIGFLGSVLGFMLNIIIWAVIGAVEPTYVPPGSTSAVPLTVALVPQFIAGLIFFLMLLSLSAAILPARRAARQNVVDALGHV